MEMFTSAKNTKNNKVRDGIQIAGAHEVFQTLCRPAREVMAQTRPSMMAGCGMVEEADAATGQDREEQARTGQNRPGSNVQVSEMVMQLPCVL